MSSDSAQKSGPAGPDPTDRIADRIAADWIAADWGTTQLRLWAMTGEGIALAEARLPRGMGSLVPTDYEDVLAAAIADWRAKDQVIPVLVCGMAGARSGWREAPYLEAPCSLSDIAGRAIQVPTEGALDVRILPGVSLARDGRFDVMRGEETQLLGLIDAEPTFAGIACLPGTHAKWARLADGRLLTFTTFMTGEVFSLLAERSVLRHTVGGSEDGWDEAAFAQGVEQGLAAPERLTASLFTLRAEGLVAGTAAPVLRARLSGLLIGVEIAAATAEIDAGAPVAVIGSGRLGALYARALAIAGLPAQAHSGEALARAGLVAARRSLQVAR